MNEQDKILESQIGDLGTDTSTEKKSASAGLGKAKYFGRENENRHHMSAEETTTSSSGMNIRSGWIEVDRTELAERGQFYPSDWRFFIRPATVDDIKNWSSIDEKRLDQVNDVFNEIIKSSIKIESENGNISWGKLNSWDRFWFLLKVREYTFSKGESKIQYDEQCNNCDEPLQFELTSDALVFELPDQDIIDRHWNADTRTWTIDPNEYGVSGPVLRFYTPTLEKDDIIFKWALEKNRSGKRPNETFLKFLPWMLQRITRDEKVNEKFITDCESTYKMWGVEMFSLVDEIFRNIVVEPSEKLRTICSHCGEEVTSSVRFPNGIRCLFTIQSGHTKFGKK